MMKRTIFCLFLLFCGVAVFAAGNYESAVFTDDSRLAVGGWDVVSFFEAASPVKGSDVRQTEYKDAVWFFSSEENLNRFKASPHKYEPAYGGYCAWAMSEGKLAPGRPEHWDIIDGRLYLNYSSSTRKKFLSDVEAMINAADSRWPEIESELRAE